MTDRHFYKLPITKAEAFALEWWRGRDEVATILQRHIDYEDMRLILSESDAWEFMDAVREAQDAGHDPFHGFSSEFAGKLIDFTGEIV